MKKIDDINIELPLTLEDFFTIFNEQLPLNEEEENRVKTSYYDAYKLFLEMQSPPIDAFAATRVLFLSQEQQIKERIKS